MSKHVERFTAMQLRAMADLYPNTVAAKMLMQAAEGAERLEFITSHPEQDDGLTEAYLLGLHAGRKEQPGGEVDGCTEPNCPRCLTAPHARGEMEHAGIGSYPSSQPKAATDVQPGAWMRRHVTYRGVDGRREGERIVSEDKVYADDIPLYTHPAPSQTVATAGGGVTEHERDLEHEFPIGVMLGTARKFLTTKKRTGTWGWEAEYSQGKAYGYPSRSHAIIGAVTAALASPSAPRVGVPEGLLDRVRSAEQRIADGHSIRRVPADPSDPDLVLAEVRLFLEGKSSPFWIAAAPEVPK